jgi:hypothetical protein
MAAHQLFQPMVGRAKSAAVFDGLFAGLLECRTLW